MPTLWFPSIRLLLWSSLALATFSILVLAVDGLGVGLIRILSVRRHAVICRFFICQVDISEDGGGKENGECGEHGKKP
jgi:hypothetical protein